MNWMSQYYITDSSVIIQNKHELDSTMTLGHVIEVFTGVFFCLEVAQGAEHKLLRIQHDHTYKILHLITLALLFLFYINYKSILLE